MRSIPLLVFDLLLDLKFTPLSPPPLELSLGEKKGMLTSMKMKM